MDITSFILGIFAVIVVGSLAGIGYSIFKIKEQKRINDGIMDDIGYINDKIESNAQRVHNAMYTDRRDFESKLDSRFDKLISRIEPVEKQSIESDQLKSQIKSLDSRLHTLLSRIESLEKQSASADKSKQILKD